MKLCFLCRKRQKVKDFTDDVFEKCMYYLELRKVRGFKYNEIELPPQAKLEFGYHVECYKKFVAVKRKYTEAFEKKAEKQPDLPSDAKKQWQGADTAVSSAGPSRVIDIGPEAEKQPQSITYSSDAEKQPGMDASVLSSAEQQISEQQTDKQPSALPLLTEAAKPSGMDIPVLSSASRETETIGPQAEKQPDLSSDAKKQSGTDTSVRSSAGPFQAISSEQPIEKQLSSLILFSESEEPSTMDTSDQAAGPSQAIPREEYSPKLCLFCSKFEKKIGTKRQYLKVCTEQVKASLISLAESLNDQILLTKLRMLIDLFYHPFCWITYRNNLRTCNETSDWHNIRHLHKDAFESLSQLIRTEILKDENIYFLKDLWAQYQTILKQLNDGYFSEDNFRSFTPQHLEEKIKQEFEHVIDIKLAESCAKKIVYKRGMNVDRLAEENLLMKTKHTTKLRDAACLIRNVITSIKKKKLPDNIHPDAITEGECEVPQMLHEFINMIIKGPDVRRQLSNEDKIKITSICQDIIYITTKGKIKPSKQLMLGMTVKSLTNSSKLMTILNRYGHTISYTTAESLETELAFTAAEENSLIPKSIQCHPQLNTNLAFDNFDRFVETLDGKDTLHDTVGIIYQFKSNERQDCLYPDVSVAILDEPEPQSSLETSTRRRRKFEEITMEIEPYYKKPKAITKLSCLADISQLIEECNKSKQNALNRDTIWIFSLARNSETPMWTGYNCKTLNDNTEIQSLDYLPQINASPTSYAVVHKTMMMAEKVLEETGQDHMILTYDLAIAKMAMQIQIAESPKFDNLMVNLGTFHIYLAFFKALGKYIDGSGIDNIAVQSNVIAAGSLNAFLSGKHYNRCKRIHPLLCAALRILHFQAFIKDKGLHVEQIDEHLKNIQETKTELRETLEVPPLLNHYLEEYTKFKKSTLEGEHGKTAQFCLQYTELLSCYQRLNRSIKTGDFYLYIESLFEMGNLFFVFNQPNYARWLLKYLDNLLNLKKMKPDVVLEFQRGSFGVKRTSNDLARLPVDLTLEQTINANAANSMTGIMHLTNEISARQRWAITHSIRTKIITELLDTLDLGRKDDITKELRPSKIQKDRQDLNEIVKTIKESINPFDVSIKPELFNISTGRASTAETETFLLNVNNIGETQKNKFIEECNNDPQRFEQPIKRNKMNNFASECCKRNVTSDGKKNVQIKMERDVFGRLLAIALDKKIDMKECLSYPLAPLPPALCQNTGAMFKTDKSVLAKKIKLKLNMESETPQNPNVWIIDGFFFLFSIGKLIPDTFEKLSETILRKVCGFPADEIHLVFDRYLTPSIKDEERKLRGEQEVPFEIIGPQQKTPRDFAKSLKNIKFKEALVSFLSENWQKESLIPIIGTKKILMTVEDKCFAFKKTENNKIEKHEEERYRCEHEEADTRIIYHVAQLDGPHEIIINAADTDILIVVLANYHKLMDKKIFLLSGIRYRDVEYINCKKLHENLGINVCKALPALHAFTGCDYTASFYRQGKSKALDILEKTEKFQSAFQKLNEDFQLSDRMTVSLIEEFTNRLYGVKNIKNVNDARTSIFNKTFSSKKNKIFQKIKSYNSNTMPPCFKVLKQKILRTAFVASMWLNATEKKCNKINATDFGWVIKDGKYEPLWFEGDPTPLKIDDITINEESESEISELFTSSDEEE